MSESELYRLDLALQNIDGAKVDIDLLSEAIQTLKLIERYGSRELTSLYDIEFNREVEVVSCDLKNDRLISYENGYYYFKDYKKKWKGIIK